jgi:hypothetical protein
LQRSRDRIGLPDFSRYLKAYINEDIRCAEWFLREFTSFKLVHEVLVENTQKVMRLVFFGIT